EEVVTDGWQHPAKSLPRSCNCETDHAVLRCGRNPPTHSWHVVGGRVMWHLKVMAAGCAGWLAVIASAAAQPALDRAGNIEKAAAEIAAVQAKSGADGAFAAIEACYQRELARATSLTRELEACMAQDIIVSRISAAFYASLNPEGRRQAGGPEPEAVTRAMLQRVLGTCA